MNYFLIFPYVELLLAASLSLVFFKNIRLQSFFSFVFSSLLLFSSALILFKVKNEGIQVLQVASWPSPYGITLVADLASALLVLATSIIYWAINLYSVSYIDEERKSKGYYIFANLIVFGAVGVFLTGDIFNLYVSFEILLLSSFALLTLGRSYEEIRQAIPYVSMNLVSSLAFLIGIGLIYGHTGNLNMAYLSSLLRNSEWTYGIRTASVFLFFAFAMKSAMFPLFFWLPRSYAAVPAGITALFSCLLTKAGVYSFLRVFTLIFPIVRDPYLQEIFYYCALLTMVIGVLGALAQSSLKRILSVHIMSQVGYMLWGLCLFSPLALAATIFFMIHNMIIKANLFLISGVIEKSEETNQLLSLGSLFKQQKVFSFLFFLSALSLAGLPPLSGFFAKLFLLRAGIEFEDWLGVGVAVSVSLMTLISMSKIWNEVFLMEKKQASSLKLSKAGLISIVALSLVSLAFAFYSGPIFKIFLEAGESLFYTNDYVTAVLGQNL